MLAELFKDINEKTAAEAELRERFIRELPDYLSTEPTGGGERFGAYALRTGMSLEIIYDSWKTFRVLEQIPRTPRQSTLPEWVQKAKLTRSP